MGYLTETKHHSLVAIGLVGLTTAIGTLGYLWLGRDQGATLLDALYMTVITITTVGYEEVIHLDSEGRLFTMFIAVTGIGSLFYSFGIVMDNLLASRLLDPLGVRKMQRKIDTLSDHVIVAGLGRVGMQAVIELQESGRECVVIDPRPEAMALAQHRECLIIQGDASNDEVLESAGIARAMGLIVTTGDDANNVYIVLSARSLNPKLYIVSRAVNDSTIAKLHRAGANRAISPYAIGGRRLAHLILSPTVVDFFDTVFKRGQESLNLEGIQISEGSAAAGQTIAALRLRERTGASVLVIMRGAAVIPNPDPDLALQADDKLVTLGTMTQLERMAELVSKRSAI